MVMLFPVTAVTVPCNRLTHLAGAEAAAIATAKASLTATAKASRPPPPRPCATDCLCDPNTSRPTATTTLIQNIRRIVQILPPACIQKVWRELC